MASPLSSTICRRTILSAGARPGGVEFLLPLDPGTSHPVRSHRAILAAALKAKGLSHAAIAKTMGWDSPGTVGHKLRGRNKWGPGELERMCELAGMTLVMLAEQSDDLHLARRPEAIEAAAILDEISPEEVAAAMALLRAYRANRSNR